MYGLRTVCLSAHSTGHAVQGLNSRLAQQIASPLSLKLSLLQRRQLSFLRAQQELLAQAQYYIEL